MPAVEVADIEALRRALSKYDPNLYKAMNKEIQVALKEVRTTARNLVPTSLGSGLRNFHGDSTTAKSRTTRSRAFPKFDAREVKRGIVTTIGKSKRNRNGWVGYYSLINRVAAGQIIETAGRLHPQGDPASQSNNPRAGAHFINVLDHNVGSFGRYGKGRKNVGRIIFRAAEEDQGKTRDAIIKALAKARQTLVLGYGKAA